MTKKAATQPNSPQTLALIPVALAAWLVPGAGHWYLGRPVRAIILFVTIQALFWSGVAIGGVFTVNPREELWWSRAQLCSGASGAVCYYRQQAVFDPYLIRANGQVPDDVANRDEAVFSQARALLAAERLTLVPPGSAPAYVFTGVAGMLNILCIIDVIMLCALGHKGEALVEAEPKEDAA